MKRRTLVAALPAFALGAHVRAQAAAGTDAASPADRRYVVMSLISNELTYVGAASMTTGTMLNHSRYTALPLTGAPFDRTAMEVLAGRVPRAEPGARLAFFDVTSPEAYAAQEEWFDGDKVTLPKSLRNAISQEGASRLLLLTKIRRDARIGDGQNTVGVGRLSGLGIYKDRAVAMRRDGDSTDYVLLAPFVYVRLSVIDIASSMQIRHHDIESARPVYIDNENAQFGELQQLLIDGLETAVNDVFKSA